MKRKGWMNNWLAAALVVGVVVTHTLPVHAQDDAAATAAVDASTNFVAAEAVQLQLATNAPASLNGDQPAAIKHGPTVTFWSDAILKKGDVGSAVVAIGGSARAEGKVHDAVVGIGGDAHAEGEVGAAVVAIGGDATANGDVGAAVVAIAGNAVARGEVRDTVVAVIGDVTIGSNAVVRGEVVSIGGKVHVEPGAQIQGKVTEVGIGPLSIPLKGMADWLKHCAVKFRLLAPHLSWFWVIPGLYLLGYLLITVAFPRPVAACGREITQRPATTFLLGLLTELLVPLIVAVLLMTGIGAIAVPFIYVALFVGGLVGKAALFQFLGRQIVRLFGVQMPPPVLALLMGCLLVMLLYMVPFVSLLAYALVAMWGIGAAVTASFGGARKESPVRPDSISAPGFPPAPAAPVPTSSSNLGATVPPMSVPESFPPLQAPPFANNPEAGLPPKPASAPHTPPVAYEALTLPRANFWERMGAVFLDTILVSILGSLVGGAPMVFLVALAYFAGMWAWRGTTIGGIVLNLKVVRLDDQPVTFVVALVRGLAAAFSAIVLFLGFFWIIWDREKQSWHDKIAGTVVVRQRRGIPLVCL
jgi:uncharacterized RDD family membrane protein YckC